MKKLYNDGKDAPVEATLASHIPVLTEIIEALKPQCVLEFGSGVYSTRLFLHKIPHVRSLETLNRHWYEHTRRVLSEQTRWIFEFVPSEQSLKRGAELMEMGPKPDMIFVDGEDRVDHCMWALRFCDLVILHDGQKAAYQDIDCPPDMVKRVFKQFPVHYRVPDGTDLDDRPWTTVWTKAKTRVDAIVEHAYSIEPNLYMWHQFPYFDHELPSID